MANDPQGDEIEFTRTIWPEGNPPAYVEKATNQEVILRIVFFRDIKGKTLVLHGIRLSWTVKQLRQALGNVHALSDQVNEYRFVWDGKQLEDGKQNFRKHSSIIEL